ncbi:MAG: hypothetical protein IGS23_15705 [Rivularia sp. T60_A2020_040]|nr:hypothetical protein [Rivularia sp. T60_A2020_040]
MNKIPEIGEFNYYGVFQIYDYRDIEYLPENVFNDLSIRKLSIADCYKLKELPESVGNLSYLTELEIKGCIGDLSDFTKVPDSIGKLKRLESLTIVGTAIQSLPNSIGNLENLTYL